MKKTIIYYGEPVRGWTLFKTFVSRNGMKPNDFGLIRSHLYEKFEVDESYSHQFTFSDIPVMPTNGSGDDLTKFFASIERFEDALVCDPVTGHGLYESALAQGYSDEASFPMWLIEKIVPVALRAQLKLSKPDLKSLLDMTVLNEDYEKAAIIRDMLEDRIVDLQKII